VDGSNKIATIKIWGGGGRGGIEKELLSVKKAQIKEKAVYTGRLKAQGEEKNKTRRKRKEALSISCKIKWVLAPMTASLRRE